MNQVMTIEVADFVEAVDAALADLPGDVRAELLEDLPAHLEDVVAEGGSPLERLGEPAAYAAELRAAAGLPARGRPARTWDRDAVLARLRAADGRLGSVVGYARISELIRALQPAWWLLRGYLAVQLVTGVQARDGSDALLPQIRGRVALGVVAVLAACALSVWWGRRPATPRRRALSMAASLVALWAGLLTLQSVATDSYADIGASPTYYGPLGDTSSITNIYPYGPDGKVLKNVRLLDQDGNPLTLEPQCTTQADASGAPPVFPIECTEGTGNFQPETPLEPLPSEAPSTSAGASTATPATSAASPSATPAPTTPSR